MERGCFQAMETLNKSPSTIQANEQRAIEKCGMASPAEIDKGMEVQMEAILEFSGTPPTTFQGAGSQQRAFDSDDGAVTFASDYGKAKQYHTCSNHEALYDYIYAQSPEKRCFYEMVRAGTPVKLYFDLELEVGDKLVERMDDLQEKLIEFVNAKLYAIYGRVLTEDDVLVLQSDGHKKASRHLIWNVYFQSVDDVKGFVHTYVVPNFDEGVDKGVYTKNRCFRFVDNHKLGSPRVLKSGRADGSELTRRRIFKLALLTLAPPDDAELLSCELQIKTKKGSKREKGDRPKGNGRAVKRTGALKPLEGADDVLDEITEWVKAVVRVHEEVTEPTVRRIRGAVYQWTFVRISHKKKCRLGGMHDHQNMAVNVDLRNGTVFYKCYGEGGHPMAPDGDIIQSVRLQDLPVDLRLAIVEVSERTNVLKAAHVLLEQASRGDRGLAEIYVDHFGKEYVRITQQDKCSGYIWNGGKRLWCEAPTKVFLNSIQTQLELVFTTSNDQLLAMFFEESNHVLPQHVPCAGNTATETDAAQTLLKRIASVLRTIGSQRNLYGAKSQCSSLLYTDDFMGRLDAAAYELPLKGGQIINFMTLQVRERSYYDLWSWESEASYLPTSECAVPKAVMLLVADIAEHPERVGYERCLQAAIGSMLCADIGAKTLLQFHGTTGNNMKSELINILRKCVPKIFTSIDPSVLIASKTQKSSGPTPELLQLRGARVAVLPDTGGSFKVNEFNVKAITGGDLMSARNCGENNISFALLAKPCVCTNHPIVFDVTSAALIERIGNHYFPFTHQFKKNATNNAKCESYKTTLRDEFFTYFIKGAHDYATHGQAISCDWLDAARHEYMAHINPVGQFVDDDCVRQPNAKVYAKDLLEAYAAWCERNGSVAPMNAITFGKRMTAMFGKTKTGKVNPKSTTELKQARLYVGLRLKTTQERLDSE